MPHEAPQLTFLSAVAVARAIESTTALKPEIKWPNDVLVNGSKVAGLLNEMSAETDGINFVILGIGVNLNMAAGQFPAGPASTGHVAAAAAGAAGQSRAVRRLHAGCAGPALRGFSCHTGSGRCVRSGSGAAMPPGVRLS